jgi:dihydropteroate synthase
MPSNSARAPLVMGIVNANPDSVSDAVRLRGADQVIAAAAALVDQGADLIDVGGESGRTDQAPRDPAEEIALVVPPVAALAERGVTVSIDTWKPPVAEAALNAGAALINDTSGLADVRLAELAAERAARLVIMHTRARPKEVNFPGYDDPVDDVKAFLSERIEAALDAGVDFEQIVLDPGLDYAKTPAESLEVLRRLGEIAELGAPLLLAVSRKFFIGAVTDRLPHERLAGTLAAIAYGVDHGAAILRVHDVAEVVAFLRVRAAIRDPGAAPEMPGDDRLKWLPADDRG